MRPRKLTIEGFTCFRERVTIDFEPLDVFVISGPTGAGKTTIIDAICYALYGKVPRETTVSNLISRNANALSVQLEFDAGGRRYRVHRGLNVTRTTNKRTGREQVSRDISPVQFEEWIKGDWTPLHDRVADVDAAIEEAVGLDYGGFTKCVLLPQGRFAEFLAGEAKQRRALLIDLLDIGIYERVKVLANSRAARLSTLMEERERQLRDDFADATEEALATAQARLTETKPALDAAKEERAALHEAHTHATTAAASHRSVTARVNEREAKLTEIAAAEKAASGAAAKMQQLAAALAAAEKTLKASTFDQAMHTALQIARERAQRVESARLAATRAAEAQAKIDVKATEAASASANAKRDEARILREAAEVALRAAENADRAAALRSGLKAGDTCPVCGEKIKTIAKAPAKSAITAATKAEADARAAEAKASDAAAKAERDLARVQADAKNAENAAKQAAVDLASEEEALKSALPKGVAADTATIAAAFDQQEAARKQHETLARAFEKARDEHATHEKSMQSSGQQIAALKAQSAQLESLIEQDIAARRTAAALVKEVASKRDWPEVNALIDASKSPETLLKMMHDEAQTAADRLTREIAELASQVTRITEAIERAAKYRDELAEMKAAHQVARDLGNLLRADQFQEYVIGEAMEVLAQAATEHLRTLYDRFAITVEKGEFAVADHWAADQVRPARTLSGGEMFVASLALALALSERLPELRSAAAASLESLFLDEGFGTLDDATLEPVLEALNALRLQERMVGVITHVPKVAEQIAHRIEVVKSQQGSTVQIAGAAA